MDEHLHSIANYTDYTLQIYSLFQAHKQWTLTVACDNEYLHALRRSSA